MFALLESHQGSWACIRDFNYIINEEEQFGGRIGGSSSTNYLKELMFELNAVDLEYSGTNTRGLEVNGERPQSRED